MEFMTRILFTILTQLVNKILMQIFKLSKNEIVDLTHSLIFDHLIR